MMPDSLFSQPGAVLKADHYRALCTPGAKAVAPKNELEGMQPTGHYSDRVHSLRSGPGPWCENETKGFQGFS